MKFLTALKYLFYLNIHILYSRLKIFTRKLLGEQWNTNQRQLWHTYVVDIETYQYSNSELSCIRWYNRRLVYRKNLEGQGRRRSKKNKRQLVIRDSCLGKKWQFFPRLSARDSRAHAYCPIPIGRQTHLSPRSIIRSIFISYRRHGNYFDYTYKTTCQQKFYTRYQHHHHYCILIYIYYISTKMHLPPL